MGEQAFEENLERIITQKWIALFPNGIESWSEHRRTGYPKLLPVVVNKGRNVSTEAACADSCIPTKNTPRILSTLTMPLMY